MPPPPLIEPACGGAPITDVSEEVSALPVDEPKPVPATEPAVEDSKPKRRPGRPRKKPVEDTAATEEPKDRVAYLRGIAATESPASAFAKLTAEVSTLESARNNLVSHVESVTSRIAESDASRIRVTAQIEELTKFLDTLNEQVAPLREELAGKSSEVSSVEEELAVATESLGRVRDFIVALSGGNPGHNARSPRTPTARCRGGCTTTSGVPSTPSVAA